VNSIPHPVPARVLIADHRLVRVSVRRAVEDDDALQVCAETSDAPSTIAVALRMRPDLCLIGWDIPGGGLTAIQALAQGGSSSLLVSVASTNDAGEMLAALRAGANGYVPADSDPEGLRRIVHAVLAGEAAVPRSMVRDLIIELRASALSRETTGREAQVLEGLRRGDTTAIIAQRLGISPVTVRRHISDLVHKLGVENRAALTRRDPSQA
jgi:DNA-binding NarL/FixJ family response regulator